MKLKEKPFFTLKINLPRYVFIAGLLLFVIACSVKRNTFVSRNSHALGAKDNILYNGGVALDKGVSDVKSQYHDNFWEILPVERMQIKKEAVLPGEQPVANANFDRAETKAAKAIQKHSMNIAGSEKNPQMDEAHLMLGKARYYDQRFVPALEAFNYILYKYPGSDKIYEAKIWREKTNMRLENDALAVTNLSKLLEDVKVKDQIRADANAALAQGFMNLEMKDSAIARLKLARNLTKANEEKSRYEFILGQLYEKQQQPDSAFAAFQHVIDMKRRAGRQYVIQAHVHQAAQFDFATGDTLAFTKKYKDLLEDRENRSFLDVLNHQVGIFYDRQKNYTQARKYYNLSLKAKSADQYMIASNYRNLAEISFNEAKYVSAGKYYDSTMVQLEPRSREFKAIKKKRDNLVDVIKYEGIATRNDSIISVYKMSNDERVAYYEAYIANLKKREALLKAKQAKEAAYAADHPEVAEQQRIQNREEGRVGKENAKEDKMRQGPADLNASRGAGASPAKPISAPTTVTAPGPSESNFYFYNPTTVAFGRAEFRKNWGDRKFKSNWRVSAKKDDSPNNPESTDDNEVADNVGKAATKDAGDAIYTTDYYIHQIPTSKTVIDSLSKERNFAYYQLGVIYKEKFRENQRAAVRFEKLLDNNPEERLILPTMYNLFKIYEVTDKDKAAAMKDRILKQYPDSRYAQILNNPDAEITGDDNPEVAYGKLFRLYEAGDYREALKKTSTAIDLYAGDENVPKFEMLKATLLGKLYGILEYKKALNFIALNYPNSEEGKRAEDMLGREVVLMEALTFNSVQPTSWKIIYRADDLSDKKTIALYGKIAKFIKDRASEKITSSYDIYTMDKNFIVIHGMKTEDHAKGIAAVLKEFKDYKIQETPYVISNDNYKVIQIKKNFDEWLKVGNGPIVPKAPPIVPDRKSNEPEQAKPQAPPPAVKGKATDAVPGAKQNNISPPIDPMSPPDPSGMALPPQMPPQEKAKK